MGTRMFALLSICVTLFAVIIGQLSIKKGMLQITENSHDVTRLWDTLFNALINPWVIFGLLMAMIAACAWILTLSRVPLSYAYPFISLTFPAVVILSSIVFNESVSLRAYIGLGLLVGALVMTSTGT
jgi:drug/metabolite transporter (DMT)-like permease